MGLKLIEGNATDGGYIIEGNTYVSYRGLEALYLSALGLNNKDAAEKMCISINTYRNHVYGVMKKLGAGNRANALLIAIENGMFEVTGHHFLLGWSPDEWVLCWKCNRAFPGEEAIELEQESFIVDHVLIEPRPDYICPYPGCGAGVWEGWLWSEVREVKPEFPEIPEKDKVYKVTWLGKEAQEFIDRKRSEVDKGK